MKARITTITLLILFLSYGAIAQKSVELFQSKFPALSGELEISKQPNEISSATIAKYRQQIQKINDAYDDIEAYTYGVLTDDNTKVFRAKELKKAGGAEEVKAMLDKEKSAIIIFIGTRAQYGADSIECIKNLSVYNQLMKNNRVDEAFPIWKTLFTFYPMSNKVIYSKGTTMIESKIKKADEAEKDAWVDTLIMVYDQRIKYFGDDEKYPEGFILGRKASAVLEYRPSKVEEIYTCLNRSLELQGEKSEASVILDFMNATEVLFKSDLIDASQVVDNFTRASGILNKQIAAEYGNASEAMAGVEKIFTRSGAASCEQLVKAYQPKYETAKAEKDIDGLKKIAKMLDKSDCTDSELYEQVAISMNDIEPSAIASYSLARFFVKKENYKEAEAFYSKAIELETEDSLKANYYYELALVQMASGKKNASRTSARSAIKLNPNYGAAYIIIAKLYASSSSSCGADAFEKKWVFWVAVDKLVTAKKVDPSVAVEANKLINDYTRYFPTNEEGFMQGKTRGSRVTVGCWINESTTARY